MSVVSVRSMGHPVVLAVALSLGACFDEAGADGRGAGGDAEVEALWREVARRAADGHEPLRYRELWEALDYTDEAPGDPDAVLLLYSGRAHPKADKVSGRLNPNHGPDSWNREHVWPRSRGFPDDDALAHNDLHHVRAADVTCNADRAALDFDDGGRTLEDCAARRDRDSFEPRDAVKGDVARMVFYMAVRYDGAGATADLELAERPAAGGARLGRLCTLLRWHEADPVDAVERDRHARIVEVQGNRNPFVDEPDLARRLFAGRCP